MHQSSSFVWYQINDTFHFLSPESVFESVDLPYWQAIQDIGELEIDLFWIDSRNSIAEYFLKAKQEEPPPFTQSQQRRELIKAIGDASLHDTNQNELVRMFEGRNVLLSEVFKALHYRNEQGKWIIEDNRNLLETLQKLYLQGFFDWSSSIGYPQSSHSSHLCCRRCGQGESKSLEQENIQRWMGVENNNSVLGRLQGGLWKMVHRWMSIT